MKKYYVYILASKRNGTLYIGFTNDIERRVGEHKNNARRSFTSRYKIYMLVYFEEFNNSYDAFRRERQMKKWKRDWKLKLIEENNPNWNDLAEDWL